MAKASEGKKDGGKTKGKGKGGKYGLDLSAFAGNDFQIVKKLTGKFLVGDIRKIEEGPLYAIVGIASDTKSGSGAYGEWLALLGQFKAIPLVGDNKGKKFASGSAFLPDVLLDGIAAQLTDGGSVQFAYYVTKIEDPDVARGYRFGAEMLVKPAENDPMKLLAERIADDS